MARSDPRLGVFRSVLGLRMSPWWGTTRPGQACKHRDSTLPLRRAQAPQTASPARARRWGTGLAAARCTSCGTVFCSPPCKRRGVCVRMCLLE